MGWTSITTKKSFEEVFKQEFASLDVVESEFCKTNTTQSVQFLTVKHKKSFIFILVILWQRDGDEVFWKEMDETEGPNTWKHKCPKKVFDSASPLEHIEKYGGNLGYSKEWRTKQI